MWPWQFHGWNNYYLGYSVEPTCLSTPFVPWTERPRQAFMMGKYLGYFLAPQYVLTDPVGGGPAQMADDFYQKFSEEENTTFIAGQFDLYMSRGYTKPPPGIVQQPRLQREAFQKLIAQSRVMVGIGNSLLSPTPYEALCLGIPFINPVFEWNKDDPEDRRFWQTQHEALTVEGLDEPYVYHVKRGDREGFKAAIKKAMNTPIARFVPPRMTTSAVLERMKTLLETDWRAMAKQQMEATGYSGPRPDTDDFRD
ncbi:hypothetical protein FRB90_000759 [Tulasnella sp. 427]|nr:hypothetical protein FRB90_000759 [Tulasnella sp. 427]